MKWSPRPKLRTSYLTILSLLRSEFTRAFTVVNFCFYICYLENWPKTSLRINKHYEAYKG